MSSPSTSLLSRYTKRSRNIIIIYLLAFMTILALAALLIILFLNLLPSIKLGKEFIPIECFVNRHLINRTIEDQGNYNCMDLNSEIWWYHSLGQNAFYHNVVEHGDDDYYNHHPKPTIFSSSFEFEYNNSNNTNSNSSNSNSNSNNNSSSHHDDDYTICYQGLFEVSYKIDNQTYHSNISGTWNTNMKWVLSYLAAFQPNTTSSCVYQSNHYEHVNWFGSDKFSVTAVILMSMCLLFMIVLIIINSIFIKNRNVKKYQLLPSHPVNIASSFSDS